MFPPPPQCDLGQLASWLATHFHDYPAAELDRLPSERDLVALVKQNGRPTAILKVANPAEEIGLLHAQVEIHERLRATFPSGCRVIPNRERLPLTKLTDDQNRVCWARLLTFVPGRTLASIRYRSSDLLHQIGQYLGRMNQELATLQLPALKREFPWNLQQSPRVVSELAACLTDIDQRSHVDRCLAIYNRHVRSLAHELPCSVIHNDANDHNILVDVSLDVGSDQVVGLIDFGDAAWTWTVSELAIALAYLLLDAEDVWSVWLPVIAGYHQQRPLSESELQVLFGLVLMRLSTSAVMAAEGARRSPDQSYLQISQQPLWRTLPRLLKIPYSLATAAARDACSLPPLASGLGFKAWATTEGQAFAYPLGLPEKAVGVPLNLGCESPLLARLAWPYQEPEISLVVEQELANANADYGIGHYFEPRIVYQSPQFGSRQSLDAQRTIHLGMDLFAAAGTPVRAVAAGTVHAVDQIDLPLDYGTLVVLKHPWTDGRNYYTLYGHLASFASLGASFASLGANTLSEDVAGVRRLSRPQVGSRVGQGEIIGLLGDPAENGGWPPHLHFQILLDDLDDPIGFPGVGQARLSRVWAAFSPNPQWVLNLPACRTPACEDPVIDFSAETQRLHQQRRRVLGKNLRTSYRSPLHLVHGRGVQLFDSVGRKYLDAYNNVPHLGHGRREVIEAAELQMRLLNTNTRYLHEQAIRFSERLAATMPPALEVCFFLNSASEANELALRLARAYSDSQRQTNERTGDVYVMEGAYHGHTTSLIDCSPYKHAGPGGQGCPDWVQVVDLPDLYRGKYRDPETASERYADDVAKRIAGRQQQGHWPTAWIAETCPSVGGQHLLPAGYLARIYSLVRAVGGVCIADEVQTGYGRLGKAFYGFEMQQVEPDIVVLGKPIGNGFPLAAVVTSTKIADAFDNGMEFFSTFGGSTVSCAVGDCVLRLTQEEGLQQQALATGRHLQSGFESLQREFSWIGDIRGCGLFWGLDLVRDPNSREPSPELASFVKQRMCERGVLVGTDGQHNNVIKIRPPLVFSITNADVLLETLRTVCLEADERR